MFGDTFVSSGGFGPWTPWTPVVTCSGGMTWVTTSIIYSLYRYLSPSEIDIKTFLIGTTGAAASNRIYISLPFTPVGADAIAKIGVTQINDGWATARVGSGYIEATGPRVQVYKADDTNFALAANRVLIFNGSFMIS